MLTPDITKAQIASVLTFVVGQAVAWGWLSSSRSQLVVSIGSAALAGVWKFADAWIRNGRSKAAAAKATAAATTPAPTPVVPS